MIEGHDKKQLMALVAMVKGKGLHIVMDVLGKYLMEISDKLRVRGGRSIWKGTRLHSVMLIIRGELGNMPFRASDQKSTLAGDVLVIDVFSGTID